MVNRKTIDFYSRMARRECYFYLFAANLLVPLNSDWDFKGVYGSGIPLHVLIEKLAVDRPIDKTSNSDVYAVVRRRRRRRPT